MKSRFLLIAFLLFVSFSQVHSQSIHVSVGFQTFYDELEPYGTWVNYPNYGYVWRYRPSSGEFRPYSTNGRWVYTDDGWTWVSAYHWGWAPFHYGRWIYDDILGWLWVPGNEWAPAWVTWGSYNDNFAWAPIAPGISITIGSSYRPPANYWVVCPGNYFGRSDWYNHAVRNEARVNIINRVTIINNYRRPENGRTSGYYRGPDTKQVERYTKAPVQHAAIAESAKPGNDRLQNNRATFYRPNVNDDRKNAARRPAPAKPADAAQLKSGRPAITQPGRPSAPNEKVKGVPVQPPHQNNPGDLRKPLEHGKEIKQTQPSRPQQQVPAAPVNRPAEPQRQIPKEQRIPPSNNRPAQPQQRRDEQPRPATRPAEPQRQMPQEQRIPPPNNRPAQPQQRRDEQPRPANRPIEPQRQAPQQQRTPPQNNRPAQPPPQRRVEQPRPAQPANRPEQQQKPVKPPPHKDQPDHI